MGTTTYRKAKHPLSFEDNLIESRNTEVVDIVHHDTQGLVDLSLFRFKSPNPGTIFADDSMGDPTQAKEAGVKDLTSIHAMRHTFASQLVMNGVDLPTVQRLMGHTDIQTTMIYAHLAPDHLADAVDKIGITV